jgi:uncharacterized RmlC-like cupin family protein
MHENPRNHILNIRIKYKVIWIIIVLNIQTRVHNYHETLILIYFTHQHITYGITESIHIRIMYGKDFFYIEWKAEACVVNKL